MTEPVKRFQVGQKGAIYVLAADYASLEQECERLRNIRDANILEICCLGVGVDRISAERDAALKQVELLRAALVEARELIAHGDFDTGVCCCGGDVDKHGFGDGHSPVDEGGYYALGVMQRIDGALQAKPCATTK